MHMHMHAHTHTHKMMYFLQMHWYQTNTLVRKQSQVQPTQLSSVPTVYTVHYIQCTRSNGFQNKSGMTVNYQVIKLMEKKKQMNASHNKNKQHCY